MKKMIFSIALLTTIAVLSSCNDDQKGSQNNMLSANTDTRITAQKNDDFNNWALGQLGTLSTPSNNNFKYWNMNFDGHSGSLFERSAGDRNRWRGSISKQDKDKQYIDTLTLNTTVNGDYNEWVYCNYSYEVDTKKGNYTSGSTQYTYYLRTSEKDNFNQINIYNSSNLYLFSVHTFTRDNFNSWKIDGFDNWNNQGMICMVFTPVIIMVSNYM